MSDKFTETDPHYINNLMRQLRGEPHLSREQHDLQEMVEEIKSKYPPAIHSALIKAIDAEITWQQSLDFLDINAVSKVTGLPPKKT